MRKIYAVVFLFAASFFTGCDDRDAQSYATELIGVLDSYQTQVNEKVKAEKRSYKELAAIYQESRLRVSESSLKQERRERSRKLVTAMIRSEYFPTSSDVLANLKDYGEQDFDTTRKLMELEADAQSQFLGDIEALEFDVETIAALKESLKDLAKPKGKLARLKAVAVFASESKKEFDGLLCQDLQVEIDDLTKQVQVWAQDNTGKNKGKINTFQTLIGKLNEQKTAKHCK